MSSWYTLQPYCFLIIVDLQFYISFTYNVVIQYFFFFADYTPLLLF